jgi:hypothetical protein
MTVIVAVIAASAVVVPATTVPQQPGMELRPCPMDGCGGNHD